MTRNRQQYTEPVLKLAEQRRQAILDHTRANPWCDYDSIVAAVRAQWPDTEPNAVRGLVANMTNKRELAATGAERERTYLALVETTISAAAVRAAYLAKKTVLRDATAVASKIKRKPRKTPDEPPTMKQIEPGRVRYSCGHTKPAQDSRGQGSLRAPATISLNQLY